MVVHACNPQSFSDRSDEEECSYVFTLTPSLCPSFTSQDAPYGWQYQCTTGYEVDFIYSSQIQKKIKILTCAHPRVYGWGSRVCARDYEQPTLNYCTGVRAH